MQNKIRYKQTKIKPIKTKKIENPRPVDVDLD